MFSEEPLEWREQRRMHVMRVIRDTWKVELQLDADGDLVYRSSRQLDPDQVECIRYFKPLIVETLERERRRNAA